jgi:murein DD-endopeptidase MepM/ murein hydrolase activator NlpD
MRRSSWSVLLGALACAAAAAAAPSGDLAEGRSAAQALSASTLPTDPLQVEAELKTLTERAQYLTQQRVGLGSQIEALRARRGLNGRAYSRMARAGLLPAGGGFAALIEHATRLERLRRALLRDLDHEQRLTTARNRQGEELTAIAGRKGPLELQREALLSARSALVEAQEREEAFQRAFSGNGDHTAVYAAAPGPGDDVGNAFSAQQGRLPFPVVGRSEIRHVTRPQVGGPGLEFRVTPGASVRAIHSGRVAFAAEYPEYGQTVIIDHGDGYFSVCAGLGDVRTHAGDPIARGAAIGSAGADGVVYVELRRGASLIEPGNWFGI